MGFISLLVGGLFGIGLLYLAQPMLTNDGRSNQSTSNSQKAKKKRPFKAWIDERIGRFVRRRICTVVKGKFSKIVHKQGNKRIETKHANKKKRSFFSRFKSKQH